MASSRSCVRREKSDTERCFWTEKQNKVFEKALVRGRYTRKVGESGKRSWRRQNSTTSSKTLSESGLVPIPNYKSSSPSSVLDHQDRILKHLRLN